MNQDLHKSLAALRKELEAAQGPRRPGRRLPRPLRARMQTLAAECRLLGWSDLAVAEALGVGRKTVKGWFRAGLGQLAKAPSVAVVPVQVELQPRTLTVVSPDGWRVVGIELSDAVTLLRQLR